MASVFKRGGKGNRGGAYQISWVDHTGKRSTKSSRTTDKAAAERIVGKLEADAALRREGVIDPTLAAISKESQRTVESHLADFRANLKSRQNTPKHVRMTCRHIEWLTRQTATRTAADLTGAAITDAVGALRGGGGSLRTCNAYLRSIKSFTRWLWTEKRISHEPLAGLRQFNEATDRRHERRAMTPEEVDELLRFTEGYTSPNHNLTGPDRAKLYRLAFGTGFRANELRSLTPASFDLASDPPTITVAAAYSKRRRHDVQPIRVDLAELLRPWLDTKQPDKRVFGKLPEATARMLRSDLAAARSAWIEASADPAEQHRREESDFLCYRDRSGRVADFHSTRHTYISGIVAGNASVKVAQELARHSTSRLTIDRYAHTRLHDVTAALEALPAERRADTSSEVRAATGTEDPTPGAQRMRSAQDAIASETLRIAATGDAEANGATKNAVDPKSMKPTTLGDVTRSDATGCDKRRRRDSNPGWRICNPLP